MGVGSYLQDMGGKLKDATGNVAKAYLCVRDIAGKQTDMVNLEDFFKDSEEVQKEILKAAANKLKSDGNPITDPTAAEAALKGAVMGSSLSGLSFDEMTDILSKNHFIPVQVQYNPSSLKMRSDLGGRRKISPVENVGAGSDTQSIKDIPKNTELSCTLIFERINVNDAFIQASEGWNASIGNALSTVGDAVQKITGGSDSEPYSVRPIVEGFISLLSTMYTRDVIFYYGKMCFHGELTSVRTEYKMFNKSGDPIYAEVFINIRQNSLNKYDQDRWRTSFDYLFKDTDKDDGNDESAGVWDSIKKNTSKGFNQIMEAFSGGIF